MIESFKHLWTVLQRIGSIFFVMASFSLLGVLAIKLPCLFAEYSDPSLNGSAAFIGILCGGIATGSYLYYLSEYIQEPKNEHE